MNFAQYLESRFVKSQLALHKKQSTGGHGENHAILALMWVVLKAITIYHLVLISFHYLAIALRIVRKPRSAKDLAADEVRAREAAKAEADKFVKDAVAAANNPENSGLSVVK